MRRGLLAFLLAFILYNAPWRLMVVCAEMPFLSAGHVRLTSGDDRYWDVMDLQGRLEALGWEIQYAELEPGLGGGTNLTLRQIAISNQQSWNERLSTLAHEAGHTEQPGWFTHNQREAFAELVSVVVAKDGFREHARYLARMKGDTLLVAITEWPRIYRTAEMLRVY